MQNASCLSGTSFTPPNDFSRLSFMYKGDIVRLRRPVFSNGREVPAGVEGRIVELFACLPSAEVAIHHNNETLVLPVTLALLERLGSRSDR